VGEQAFTEQEVGSSSEVPRTVFVAFEIPVGQKLYLRDVRVKPAPLSSFPWLLLLMAGAFAVVLVIALAAWATIKNRRARAQGKVQPAMETS
jgi:hypothetical protein